MEVKDKSFEYDGQTREAVLTITATPEEVSQAAKQFFKELGQREIPGFRKGKAPREVLEQSVGGHEVAMGGVAEKLVNEGAFAAIDAADIIFLEEPQFNVDVMPEEGRPFSFTVSGIVAPEMKLASYDPVTIKMPPDEATDEDIKQAKEDLQDLYHTLDKVTEPDHVASMGDYVDMRLTVTNHGKLVSGMNNVSRMVGLGHGTMPDSFDEHIVGTKVGDLIEFDFQAKDEQGNSEHGDGELHAQAEICGFRELRLPEVNDELAIKVGCTDVEDLNKQLKRNIEMQKAEQLPKLKVDRAAEAISERLDGDVPEYYVDFIRQDVGRELMQSLEDQGINLQQWLLQNNIQGEQMKEDVNREAMHRAAIDLALDAIFAHESMQITDEDIQELFAGEDDAEEKLASWRDANRMSNLRKMARQRKATKWLVDNAIVEAE
ncbi:MAG: trigger factor [Eggerthellaceae bacterium]|nr:trigger factor [Eggerthellaceae bacterium]